MKDWISGNQQQQIHPTVEQSLLPSGLSLCTSIFRLDVMPNEDLPIIRPCAYFRHLANNASEVDSTGEQVDHSHTRILQSLKRSFIMSRNKTSPLVWICDILVFRLDVLPDEDHQIIDLAVAYSHCLPTNESNSNLVRNKLIAHYGFCNHWRQSCQWFELD